ncbi:hypothetical protein PIB30_000893, partial [Stylosanthes scabra]|nr:hypothetical protein [Stylosanthes scabra]
MKEIERRKTARNSDTKSSRRTVKRENILQQDNSSKTLSEKGTEFKAPQARPTTKSFTSDSNTARENSETYENMVIHYVDDVNRSEEVPVEMKVNEMVANEGKNKVVDGLSSDLEKEQNDGNEEVSDTETVKDSVSSQGDSFTNEDDENIEKASKDPKSKVRVVPVEGNRGLRERSGRKTNKLQSKVPNGNQKKPMNSNNGPSRVTNKNTPSTNSKTVKAPVKFSSESSDGNGNDEKSVHVIKEIDIIDGSSNGAQSVGSEDESNET